jgi:hypothetical protein
VNRLLEVSYDPQVVGVPTPSFEVYRSRDFRTPMETGLSLFLYRIRASDAFRSTPSKIVENGQRRLPQMPVDLNFLITPWGKTASAEQELLGWAMRVLADNPILPAALMNGVLADSFADDEAVEVVPGDVPIEDMMRVWDSLGADYQVSVPYVARSLRIESLIPAQERKRTVEREFRMRTP